MSAKRKEPLTAVERAKLLCWEVDPKPFRKMGLAGVHIQHLIRQRNEEARLRSLSRKDKGLERLKEALER